MRINDTVWQVVVFLGFLDQKAPGGIRPIGTGFVQSYGSALYLVTVAHVAKLLGGDPFVFRINNKDGSSLLCCFDDVVWHYHPDENVDVAVMEIDDDLPAGHAGRFVPQEMLASPETVVHEEIGVGDFCYTVGLFRLLAGNQRNLPVVHTGHIALLPGDEKVPFSDRTGSGNTRHVEAYLVESQSLSGLSGAPVFVRPSLYWALDPRVISERKSKDRSYVQVPRQDLFLLGIWQGAWDAPADQVIAADRGGDVRVPLGIGVVVPTFKLVELLNIPELATAREKRNGNQ